jgi:DNA-binding beta-propeller fold protein YncE
MAPRRIDALYSTRDAAKETFERKRQEMQACAGVAKKSIDESFREINEALKQRQAALHKEVDELLDQKMRKLTDQLSKTEERKVDEEHRLREDEKLLKRLQDAQQTGAPMDDADKAAAGGDPDWIATRIKTLTASVEDLRADNPEWVRVRDDEVVSFKPKRCKELVEQLNSFGAVDGTSTYASESSAQGPLIEGPLKVGFKTWLQVRACDLHGRQRKDGGDKMICTWSQNSADGPKTFEQELVDKDDGTYKLNVVPLSEGTYTLNMEFEHPGGEVNEPIQGSPFKVLVTTPFDYSVLGDDTLGQAGQAWIDAETGYLRRPAGIQFDPKAEFVFVADQSNDRIQAFKVDTKEQVCAFGKKGSGTKDLNTPGYIVADREDRIIVSDMLNHRLQVLRFNRNAFTLRHERAIGFQGSAQGQFSFPRGIALTQTGLLLVCDSGNNRIQVLDANNDFSFAYAFGDYGSDEGKFIQPYDVAVNSSDEILVSDSCHRIQIFNAQGKFLRAFGTRGKSKPGKFRHPTAITVDNEDTIFVCDRGNHRVQVFTPDGEFKHMWAGYAKKKEITEEDERAETPDIEDGEWYGIVTPIGITVSAAGQVLISDYDKHVIFDY